MGLPKENPVRRNKPAPETWTDLPIEGRTEPVPAVPFTVELGTDGLAWWAHQWRSPSASQWLDSDWHTVVRRAQLEDQWQGARSASVAAEIRFLDASLGLTAKSRRELRWRVVDSDGVSENAEIAPVRRLKVVDPQAAG